MSAVADVVWILGKILLSQKQIIELQGQGGRVEFQIE